MRHFYWLIIICMFFLALGCVQSSEIKSKYPKPPPGVLSSENLTSPPLPPFEKDKSGRELTLDFGLRIKSVSNPDILFSHFSSRQLLIFYFSPKCVHCRHAFPYFLKLSDELNEQGISTVAIAVKNASQGDIRDFIRENRVNCPVFHDHEGKFSGKYGTGLIPLVLVIDNMGRYRRFKDFDSIKTPPQIKKIFYSH